MRRENPLELMQQGRYNEAIALWLKQKEKEPDNLSLVSNLGVALTYVLRLDEAIALYRRALARFPNHEISNVIRWNLATPLLMLGQLREGFALYEYRAKLGRFSPIEKEKFPTPSWQGESLAGKTLYVRCEEGLGDAIQFLRYLPYLSSHSCHVILEMRKELHPLFAHFNIPLIAPPHSMPRHDVHVEAMSFPYVFQTDLSTIPPPLALEGGPCTPKTNRIGIVWRGNPRTARDRHRSLPLQALTPLFHLPHKKYVSLQKDPTPEEAVYLIKHGVEMPSLNSFADTLQALKNCEQVIAVDTMIAHLAGSLRIPTKLLISYVPEWRWLLERADSPWYCSITILRQRALDSWEELISRLCYLLQGPMGKP